MDILFCDICNESVPQADISNGRAILRGTRVVCAQCEAAMGHGGGPGGAFALAGGGALQAGRFGDAGAYGTGALGTGALGTGALGAGTLGAGESRGHGGARGATRASGDGAMGSGQVGGGVGVFFGLLAIGVAAAGTWLAVERVDGLERRHAAAIVDLESELDATRRARATGAAELQARMEEVRASSAAALAGVEGDVARGNEELRTEFIAAQAREAALREELAAARARAEEVLIVARREREADARALADLQVDLRAARDRLIAVEENLRVVGARTPVGPVNPAAGAGEPSGDVAGGGAAGAPAQPAAPAWQRHLADLASQDEGLRIEAVIALGDTRDPAVAVHVVPMLKDPNLWVRMVAAEVLGKVGDVSSVPALIDALEDERTAVREHALFALQALTHETLRFDANASESERTKRVREWRDWWGKNRERLTTG
ncbi:MAG: HEAT repeat domain-containing protein [Planctomycetota bacterium]